MPCFKAGRQSGFGLLEAIVATVLMAAVGASLFSWLTQGVQSASRVQEAAARAELQQQVLQAMAEVNPAQEPRGERAWGGLRLSWQSELQSPLRYSVPFGGAEGVRWQVGLYRVKVHAQDAYSGGQDDFELLRTGLVDLAAVGAGKPANGAREE